MNEENRWNDRTITHHFKVEICEYTRVLLAVLGLMGLTAWLIYTAMNGAHIRTMGLMHRGFERVKVKGYGFEWLKPDEAKKLELIKTLEKGIDNLNKRIKGE